MKHTIKGLHGHVLRVSVDSRETVCISRSEAAKYDFDSMEYELREKLSVKWKVCMYCWDPNPTNKYYGHRTKKILVAYTCGFGGCKAWGKPKKFNARSTKG